MMAGGNRYNPEDYSDILSREKLGTGGGSRVDKFLGFSSSSYSAVLDSDGLSELNEADVWDLGAVGGSDQSHARNEYGHDGMASNRPESTDSFRFLNTSRRWTGMEKEPGLSAAFGDGSRGYGLSGLSPQRHVNLGSLSTQSSSRDVGSRGIPTAARMIPPIVSMREASARPAMHQSAPVNVPDWSKILGAEKKPRWADESQDDDKEDVEEERLPPHLQLQREYAQSQITTFSVCEGAGRTLKGRDLSRVRNAVLRQTGFLDT